MFEKPKKNYKRASIIIIILLHIISNVCFALEDRIDFFSLDAF